MKRKDLFIMTGFCFLSAVIGGIVSRQVFDSNVFARSGNKQNIYTQPITNSEKKGEKAFAGPTTDYIDGVLVELGSPSDGQVLKYDGVTDNRWELGSDDNDGGSSVLWELTSDTARLKTARDINFQDKKIKNAKVISYYYTAGTTLLKSNDSETSVTYYDPMQVAKTITCPAQVLYPTTTSTFTIEFEMRLSTSTFWTVYGRIYVNGEAVGTLRSYDGTTDWQFYSEDISDIVPGDDIQIYLGGNNGSTKLVKNFRVKGTESCEYKSINASPTW